ncbi:hypothetical protein B0T22DRAFT_539044 [Podospora appendiculata]|uniref:Uncharacterized protein n=1 Tax=Podospora appendiculata TaxID=314037 RepID=A0AAE1C9G1_9PEZI|nr:hypothetical protein B0T22DRAFT_539044 [Podospora appendiculata]
MQRKSPSTKNLSSLVILDRPLTSESSAPTPPNSALTPAAPAESLNSNLHSPPTPRRASLPEHLSPTVKLLPPPLTRVPPPLTPYPWVWRCHACRSVFRLGCTRRCLECGHQFCQFPEPPAADDAEKETSSKRRKTKRGKVTCYSEFDYPGWAAWGAFRRTVVVARRRNNNNNNRKSSSDLPTGNAETTTTGNTTATGTKGRRKRRRRSSAPEQVQPSASTIAVDPAKDTFAIWKLAPEVDPLCGTETGRMAWASLSDDECARVALRKERMFVQQQHDCSLHCDFPSECRTMVYKACAAGRAVVVDSGRRVVLVDSQPRESVVSVEYEEVDGMEYNGDDDNDQEMEDVLVMDLSKQKAERLEKLDLENPVPHDADEMDFSQPDIDFEIYTDEPDEPSQSPVPQPYDEGNLTFDDIINEYYIPSQPQTQQEPITSLSQSQTTTTPRRSPRLASLARTQLERDPTKGSTSLSWAQAKTNGWRSFAKVTQAIGMPTSLLGDNTNDDDALPEPDYRHSFVSPETSYTSDSSSSSTRSSPRSSNTSISTSIASSESLSSLSSQQDTHPTTSPTSTSIHHIHLHTNTATTITTITKDPKQGDLLRVILPVSPSDSPVSPLSVARERRSEGGGGGGDLGVLFQMQGGFMKGYI